jgi:hypothetical protein
VRLLMAGYTLTIYPSAIAEMTSRGGIVGEGVERAAASVRDTARDIVRRERFDTGALAQSIQVYWDFGAADPTCTVGSDLEYAGFVEEGTGLYGPRHSRIYPRRARVLRFRPKGGGAFVFAPSVAGSPGIHYLERAVARLTADDFAA